MIETSVIIPTYNRLNRLEQVLKGLEQQNVPLEEFEVIVISDGSFDGTNEYLSTLTTPLHLKYICQSNMGPAMARNCGIAHATGDIILFIDDDVVPAAQLIYEHLSFHKQYGSTTVVLGPMLSPPDFQMSSWVRWEQAMLFKQYDDMTRGLWEPTGRQFYTGNTSLARQHLIDAGGFDQSIRRAEDVELAYRLADRGLSFVFNPSAVGYHYAERDFDTWISTPYTYGVNDVIFFTAKGQRWLLPAIRQEYNRRHLLTRALVQMTLDRRILSKAAIFGLKDLLLLSDQLQLHSISMWACSGIFNLRYFQGLADEIGGRDQFFSGIKGGAD
jgi:glycosyltransferase involved in cell wall biosynthesis